MDGNCIGDRIRDCMIEPACEFDIRRVYIYIGKERGSAIYLFSLRKKENQGL